MSPLTNSKAVKAVNEEKKKKISNTKKHVKPSKKWVLHVNFSDTLYHQKSPALLVPVADGGDEKQPDIAIYILNRPRR